jgi:hypothetical protein
MSDKKSPSTPPAFGTNPPADMQLVLQKRAEMVKFIEDLLAQVKAGQVYGIGVATVAPGGLGSGWSMMCDGWLLNGAIARLKTHFEHSVLHVQLDEQLGVQRALASGNVPPELAALIQKAQAGAAAQRAMTDGPESYAEVVEDAQKDEVINDAQPPT